MIKLNIAFHECLDGDDVDETNLWFDAELEAQDLLDALEGESFEPMTRLLADCYNQADTFYRMIDNEQVVWVGDKTEHNVSDALGYDEWHVDVDWDNGRYLCLLGAGFGEEMASDEVVAYLKEKAAL